MRQRYLCKKHEESTPSAVVYGERVHCFGCGASYPASELGIESKEGQSTYDITPEDIAETAEYIRSLPLGTFRGLEFHYDSRGFYILYPDSKYYKYRLFDVDTPGGKYRSPFGVAKPFMRLGVPTAPLSTKTLFVVEGEINALSLYKVAPSELIVCPGGAGDFYSRRSVEETTEWGLYKNVRICVDADKAGAQAGIEMKARLAIRGVSNVRIILLEKDFNDILTQDGLNALEAKYKEILEVS